MRILAVGALVFGALSTSPVLSQTPAPPPQTVVAANLDSGYLDNPTDAARTVFTKRVRYDGTAWMQLRFRDVVNLPGGSFVRMTSSADGGVQRHTGRTLVEWAHQSAGFNGNEVLVELVAGPKTIGNRVAVDEVVRGLPGIAPAPETICGPVDNRALSSDPRAGRLFRGCTGWLIGQDVMLTAGHCVTTGTLMIEFNVPLSTPGGSIVRANPNDQYPFTLQGSLNSGIGSDWCVASVGTNSNTGLLPGQANGGQWFSLGAVPTSTPGQNIRITGYGSTSSPVSPTWYLVQKTHVGGLAQINATSLCYTADTTGGNSGSPVIHENTGNAIGIHTHGGCGVSGGCNSGTRVDRADVQAAIAALNPNAAGFQTYGLGCPTPVTFYELFDSGNTNDLAGRSFLMSPNAGGGWSVTPCATNCFEPNFSNNLNLSDDQLSTNHALGFAFPLTGIGGTTTAIDIDSNGWIGLIAGQHSGTDYTESVSELLGDPARLAAYWDDLNPASAGGVYFDTFPGRAVVTWYQVPEFGSSNSNTIQVQFFSNGDLILHYATSLAAGDGLVGYSAGNNSPDPGGIDLSTSVPFSTGAGGTPVTIGASALPVLGSSMQLTISNLPANRTTAVMNLGVTQSNVSLAPFGADGCALLTTPVWTVPMTLGATNASATLNLPNLSFLLGTFLYAQGAVLAPGANQLGALTSDGGALRLGT